mmetsp:Transcript_19605/g.37065  ORF Transcript_19605/g.37065 Transcript_19605/m.37065 type:complete len:330 (-) Transcript_19605:84-1073(-)|eukprot:scaffold44741_cov183-Amphora_coffeaeformis.AAC.1
MSYQNGGHRVVMGAGNDDFRVKPMDYLEAHKRRNRCLSLSLLALLCIACGSLMIWRIQQHRLTSHGKKRHSLNQDDDSWADDDDFHAPAGLTELNSNLKHQSKIISEGCESTMLIVRHCEKQGPSETDHNGNFHCSYLGQERSYFLSTLFGTRWPVPSQLFALTPERGQHLNFREYETLHPLSIKTGIPIEPTDQDKLPKQYFDLLKSGEMCGKLTVVSWKHELFGDLANKLGCTPYGGCPEKLPESEYDQVWQLKFVFHPFAPDDLKEEQEFFNNHTNRQLKSKTIRVGWRVFGTVSYQGYDPLAFSYKAGDYPVGGTPTGGKWKNEF